MSLFLQLIMVIPFKGNCIKRNIHIDRDRDWERKSKERDGETETGVCLLITRFELVTLLFYKRVDIRTHFSYDGVVHFMQWSTVINFSNMSNCSFKLVYYVRNEFPLNDILTGGIEWDIYYNLSVTHKRNRQLYVKKPNDNQKWPILRERFFWMDCNVHL